MRSSRGRRRKNGLQMEWRQQSASSQKRRERYGARTVANGWRPNATPKKKMLEDEHRRCKRQVLSLKQRKKETILFFRCNRKPCGEGETETEHLHPTKVPVLFALSGLLRSLS